MLDDAVQSFLARLPLKGIANYEDRVWVNELEAAGRKAQRQLQKEQAWLRGNLTRPIILGARNDLSWAADQLIEAATPKD